MPVPLKEPLVFVCKCGWTSSLITSDCIEHPLCPKCGAIDMTLKKANWKEKLIASVKGLLG